MRLRLRIFFSELPRGWLDTRSTRTRVATRRPRVPLLAEAAFAGGTERSGQNCAERVGLSAQLAVQL